MTKVSSTVRSKRVKRRAPAIDARVRAVREQIERGTKCPGYLSNDPAVETLGQPPVWGNWGNWANWANWSNWANWANWASWINS